MKNCLKGKQKKVRASLRLLFELIDDEELFSVEQTFALRQAMAAVDAAVTKWEIPSYTSDELDADLRLFANDFYKLTHRED
jgi:hypothetical protein